MDCLFCKIIKKEIPADIIYEDDRVLAFKDINPAAPVHILIIPKEHIESILEVDDNNMDMIVHIHKVAKQLAKDLKIADKGFRLVTNCGDDAGQSVKHLHYHLIGGKVLLWAH